MSLLEVNTENSCAELALNRVDKMNALSSALIADLTSALETLSKQAIKGEFNSLIIRSNSEKAFCAGADLKERMAMNEEGVQGALDSLRELMDSLMRFPVPTIAVVNGIAFGGGLELALACDLRIMGPGAKVGLTETKLAIIPGAGGTQRLSRIVGLAKAKEMIFLASRLNSQEAHELGIANYTSEDPLALAREWAKELSEAGPVAIRAAKKAIDGGWDKKIADALDWERRCYEETLSTEDRLEALKAFSEKRKAVFKGA